MLSRITALALGCVIAAGCGTAKSTKARSVKTVDRFPDYSLALYPPLSETNGQPRDRVAQARVTLGRTLFYQTFTVGGKRSSCSSCHALFDLSDTTGSQVRSVTRLAPSLYNLAGQLDQLQTPTFGERAATALLSPKEMGLPDSVAVVSQLHLAPGYTTAFAAAFPAEPAPMTFTNVGRALDAFARGLVTPSRWDRFLRGDKLALTSEEKAGYSLFVSTGCSDCHHGSFIGGSMFQRLGVVRQWPLRPDSGTGMKGDPYTLRVGSLRNIDKKRDPYFHSGSVTDLTEAVRLMARYQTGTELSDRDVALIVAWLKTLSGSTPEEYARPRAVNEPRKQAGRR